MTMGTETNASEMRLLSKQIDELANANEVRDALDVLQVETLGYHI